MYGFLLTRHWHDSPRGMQLEFWLAGDEGPIQLLIDKQESVFFIRKCDENTVLPLLKLRRGFRLGAVDLRNIYAEPVSAVYSPTYRQAQNLRRELKAREVHVWESDIRPPERYLMERFITGGVDIQVENQNAAVGQTQATNIFLGRNLRMVPADYRPRLRVVSVDIETSMDAMDLYSIAVYSDTDCRVFMVDESGEQRQKDTNKQPYKGENDLHIVWCLCVRECLQQFFQWLDELDPDVLIGWNLVQFDLWVLDNLCRLHQVENCLGRQQQVPHWRQEKKSERRYISIPGRVALDGIDLVKTLTQRFDSYSLESVSQVLLGAGKLLHGHNRGQEISALYRRDKCKLAAYNLRDCELVWQIFTREKLLDFAVERAQLTGLALERVGGSVAAFEYAYLPRLHRKGYVAPNLGEQTSDIVSPGGYVLDSLPGIYNHILVLDFKSLYPSIIRSFNIDPFAFWHAQHQQLDDADCVPGFNGARFAKSQCLLSTIIEDLWQAREKAKSRKNAPLSQAIKILMNSFYGVLGAPGCRFFDPRISSSITLRGHEIIQSSRDWIEQQGYQVIYGDTDSVFVWVDRDCSDSEVGAIGKDLERGLNDWWRERLSGEFGIDSALEVEFEIHYRKFFMPTIRGSELGSKKRYAGLTGSGDGAELVFKGLENVRTDWTVLAKQFQEELYWRIFLQQPYEDYIRSLTADVLAGRCDDDLVYRKRLRRKLIDYKKNIPPHVQAARKLESATGTTLKRGEWISYVLTVNGPEPVEFLHTGALSRLNYQSYIDRQLAPIADSILYFKGKSFAQIIDRQLSLI